MMSMICVDERTARLEKGQNDRRRGGCWSRQFQGGDPSGSTTLCRFSRCTRAPKESASEAMNAALAKARLSLDKIHFIVATGRGRTQVPFARKGCLKLRAPPPGITPLGALRANGDRRGRSELPGYSLHRKAGDRVSL